MTTSRRTALKALLAAPAAGAFASVAHAQTAAPATPPALGQTPVWPAPNTAPPSVQDTPLPDMPHWEGPVCSEGKARSAEKRQIDLDYAYTLRRVNTNL